MNQILFNVCQQLINDGKTPSVALLKAKAPKSVHLSEIISTVQMWKANPETFDSSKLELPEDSTKIDKPDTLNNEQLTARVCALEEKISHLEALLQKALRQ